MYIGSAVVSPWSSRLTMIPAAIQPSVPNMRTRGNSRSLFGRRWKDVAIASPTVGM